MSGRIFPLIASLLLVSYLGLQSTNAISNDAVTDAIQPGQSVTASKTIVSANGNFELCFFSPGNSRKYYVGICYKKIFENNVVWVANREYPIPNNRSFLTVNLDGTLVISNGKFQYTVANTSAGKDSYAMLLNTGNLILTNRVFEVLWQSFGDPTDTLLPGMIGADYQTGSQLKLAPWRTAEDPSPGTFILNIYLQGSIVYYWWNSTWWNSTWWNSTSDYGVTWFNTSDINSRMVLDLSGQLKLESWSEDDGRWDSLNSSSCGAYTVCDGAFSICNATAQACGCLPGFKPHDLHAWRKGNKSNGCEREAPLQCSNNINVQKDEFLLMSNVDWPKKSARQLNTIGNALECESTCLSDCRCVAYAYNCDHNSTCHCSVWDGPLLNLKQLSVGYGDDFYLKRNILSALGTKDTNSSNGPPDRDPGPKNLKVTGNNLWIIVVLSTSLATMTLGLFVYYVRRELTRKGENLLLLDLGMNLKTNHSDLSEVMRHGDSRKRDVKMPLFSFSSVSAATDNFSAANKLGEGGFGPVYKGILVKGDEVAVKRLSRRSGQGWEELKNEAMLIAKLQHKNLVRLLGCCIERDEKILVYEYMLNKSLDFFLFDPEKRRMLLDWGTRVRVIEGVAQGLLYLHQYSRLRIIHRDLKVSNILLDVDMNPKISDFGMARIFGGNESQANTNRIVGTYGYMSPEYALEGLFSIKSDVFSFGVLLLEIVSGRKNTGFYLTDSFHLLGYAWDLWTSNRGSDLVDPLLDDKPSMHMVLRFVNIALLCVQESSANRPTMSDVVAMLNNETAVLPYPEQPGFLNVRSMVRANPVTSRPETRSVNDATVSVMEGR